MQEYTSGRKYCLGLAMRKNERNVMLFKDEAIVSRKYGLAYIDQDNASYQTIALITSDTLQTYHMYMFGQQFILHST